MNGFPIGYPCFLKLYLHFINLLQLPFGNCQVEFTLQLPSLDFENGEASTWLVTHENLTPYNQLVITAPGGSVLATASIAAA